MLKTMGSIVSENDLGFSGIYLIEHNKIADLLEAEDCNIIGVDWNPLSLAPNYALSAQNCLEVGRTVGEFVVRLMDKTGLTHDKVNVPTTTFAGALTY